MPVYKGSYAEIDDRRDRRVPRRQRAAHRAGVRGRHGDDDGGQGRDQAGVQADGRHRASKFDPKAYVSAVAGYYTDTQGQHAVDAVQQLDAGALHQQGRFKKAGLDPNVAPKTWKEFARHRRQAQGRRPAMRLHHRLAELGAARELQRLAQRAVRRRWRTASAASARGSSSTAPVQCAHIQMLADLAKNGWFTYARPRATRPSAKFYQRRMRDDHRPVGARTPTSQERQVRVLGELAAVLRDVKGAPQNSIIGGASLWVLTGKPTADYKGVAKFFTFLSPPEIQAKWHQTPATCRSPSPRTN